MFQVEWDRGNYIKKIFKANEKFAYENGNKIFAIEK